MTTLSRSALRYAANGWRVFPLAERGKLPKISGGHGFLDATTDERQVREWWALWPQANIGLWPGPSGFLVVDVDGPRGRAAAQELGLLNVETLRCHTGRADGGEHLYFRRPDFEVGNFALATHLEVRCDAGYVVLPPSVHPSSVMYQWRRARVATLPVPASEAIQEAKSQPAPAALPPLAELPTASELEPRIRAYIATLPSGMRDGDGRNNIAYILAAQLLRDFALSVSEAEPWVHCWNSRNVDPLRARELRTVILSAERTGKRPKGSGIGRNRELRPAVKVSSAAIRRQRWEDALARASAESGSGM